MLRLAQIVRDDLPLVYMDGTSFNTWSRPNKTYRGPDDNVKITLTKKRIGGVTILGGIGHCIEGGLVYHLAPKTDDSEVCELFTALRANTKREF